MAFFTNNQPIASSVITEDTQVQLSFLQKVYSLFLLGLIAAIGGAVFTMNTLSLAQFILSHPYIFGFLELGVLFLTFAVRKTPGINVFALLAFTTISGASLGPVFLMFAKAQAFGLVYEAAGISGSIFVGLTAYTFITKKDFSFLRGIVSVGLFAVIGISIVLGLASLFNFHVDGASLALAWICTVLFSLFILYDTSRIMRTHESDEYVSGAISLYLDFLNLFLAILQILASGNRRD